MAVNFYLDKRLDRKGCATVRVSISVRGARFITSTVFKVEPEKWDGAKQQAKKFSTNAAGFTSLEVNQGLLRIAEHFAAYESRSILDNVRPSAGAIKGEYNQEFARRAVASAGNPGFWDYFDEYVAERQLVKQWTKKTTQMFLWLREHLKRWDKTVSFETFTEAGLAGFVGYLRDKCGHENSTISKRIGYLKWFLRWAAAKGYNPVLEFQTFVPKLKVAKKKVVFLEWEELMRVFNYEIPEAGTEVELRTADGETYRKRVEAVDGLRASRDIFCFCSFTSLRFSDAHNLKRANVQGDSMTLTTIKTSDTITIELNKYAKAILARYTRRETGEYCLPRLTNQRMNLYLKDLCELCGINEEITQTKFRGMRRQDYTQPKYALVGTHTGRRTFICNALMLGIPAEVVMKWTGHSDYKAMKPYIDVSNAAKAQQMDKFNQL